LLDRQVARIRALENLVNVRCGTPRKVNEIRRVADQPARIDILAAPEHTGQLILQRQVCDEHALDASERRRYNEQAVAVGALYAQRQEYSDQLTLNDSDR
jgi:hypothetical protein